MNEERRRNRGRGRKKVVRREGVSTLTLVRLTCDNGFDTKERDDATDERRRLVFVSSSSSSCTIYDEQNLLAASNSCQRNRWDFYTVHAITIILPYAARSWRLTPLGREVSRRNGNSARHIDSRPEKNNASPNYTSAKTLRFTDFQLLRNKIGTLEERNLRNFYRNSRKILKMNKLLLEIQSERQPRSSRRKETRRWDFSSKGRGEARLASSEG